MPSTATAEATASKDLAAKLQDRRWRINNLYWIQDEKGQKVKFRMNSVQEELFNELWWLNVIPKSRQHGVSTFVNLLQVDECLFNDDLTAGIVDKTDNDAKKKLAKIRYAYDNLDFWPDDPAWQDRLLSEGHVNTSKLGVAIKQARVLVRSNDHEMEWSNNSKVWTGTSLRGGTCQFLHISELGPIAYNYPNRAEEIRAGALNTVHVGCKVVIESTHEGGRYGLNYEMIDLAMQAPPREEMTQMDWQLHFFPWWRDPKNALQLPPGGLRLSEEERSYFHSLEVEHGITLTHEQRHWYCKKLLTQRDSMLKEHPSTLEECLNAAIRGAIYGKQMMDLKRRKRICDFTHDQTAPVYTFWDLGKTDYTAIWLIQFWGREFGLLNYFSWNGEDERFYAAKIAEWETEYGFISGHYLPHDATNQAGPGLTWLQALEAAGLKHLHVVPRTPDLWIGIRHLRSLLPRCWIHKANCSREWRLEDGVIVPSGLTCLESYRTKIQETGARIDEMPVHDEASHGADAMRTFSEAHMRGMLTGESLLERESKRGARKMKVLTGVHGNTEINRKPVRKPRILR